MHYKEWVLYNNEVQFNKFDTHNYVFDFDIWLHLCEDGEVPCVESNFLYVMPTWQLQGGRT